MPPLGLGKKRNSEAMEEIRELHTEIEEWRDSMSGTNLENTEKYQRLEYCLDALERLAEDLESALSDAENIEFPTKYD